MSALTRLYTHQTAEPSWFEYAEDDTVIFEANYLVPVLWLALFSEKHYMAWFDPDGDSDIPEENCVPCLVGRKDECLSLLDERHDYLVSLFSHGTDILNDFRKIIDATIGQYLSIEMSEVFYMEKNGEVFFQEVHNILKMFENMDNSAIEPLMRLAETKGYDLNKSDFIPAEPEGFRDYRYHAIGLAD